MMRLVLWGLLTVCVLVAALTVGDASGFEADLSIESVENPGTGAVLAGENFNISVFLHEGGVPLVESVALYTMFPDGSYLPDGWTFTSGADGWYNDTLTMASPYAGNYVVGICDPDSQDGWGGGDGFFLDSGPIDLLGISTDRQYYSAGDTVWYSVMNDPAVTNVTDVGTIEVFDHKDASVGDLGGDLTGGFELPVNIKPGTYRIRTEFGGLVGSFAVSDVAVFPDRDVYHFGETITVQTSLEDLDASVISPSGNRIYSTVSGRTDINLPGSGDPGWYTLLIMLDGHTVLRESLHVSYCDLWADTTMAVYEPGSLVKMYFSARDIGLGLDEDDLEELDWDMIFHTVGGIERVDDTLDSLSGYDTFVSRSDVVYGETLWDTGADNRIEFYLNISSRTVRRTVPLAFGEPVITVDGASHFGTDEPIVLTISTGISGLRPVWWIRTPGGDVITCDPPAIEGTDPFGRTLMRSGDLVYVAGSYGYIMEPVTSPKKSVEITVEIDGDVVDLTTDGSGSAILYHEALESGTYTITVTAHGYPAANHLFGVSGGALDLTFSGPSVVVAGEEIDYTLTVASGGEAVDAEVDYRVEFLGSVIDSGVSDGEIAVGMPDSDGTVTITGSAVVNGTVVTGSMDVAVTTSAVYIELAGGDVSGGSTLTIAYALPNASSSASIEFEALGIASGVLAQKQGKFTFEIPVNWPGTGVTIAVRAYDGGRMMEGSIELASSGTVVLSAPADPEVGYSAIDFTAISPGAEGVFLGGTMAVVDLQGAVITSNNLTSSSGTVNVDLEAGTYTVMFSGTFLTPGGIEPVSGQTSVHVRAPEEHEDDGFALMELLALVLAVVILGLLVALAGSQRKIRELKKSDRKHTKRAKKLKKKLIELEALLPSEEGHTVPPKRPAVAKDVEKEEEPEEEEDVEPAPPTSTPVRDELTMATEAPCPMCGEAVYIPAKRPATVRCADCSFEFIVE